MNEKFIRLLVDAHLINGEINLNNLIVNEIGLMPKQAVYNIYERRIKNHKSGSENLLKRIFDFKGENIRLSSVVLNQTEYILFTDDGANILLGTFKIPMS